MSPIPGWTSFYSIVGSAAGALTGLQFIVITLISQTEGVATDKGTRAFGTPTVVHFAASLIISALMAAPWQAVSPQGACLVIGALAGLVYSIRVIRHAKDAEYNPDAEDWFWYGGFPIVTYLVLLASAVFIWWRPGFCATGVAGVSLALLVIGVHNSWDTVTYIALERSKPQSPPNDTAIDLPPTSK